jgi:hypothetical protein
LQSYIYVKAMFILEEYLPAIFYTMRSVIYHYYRYFFSSNACHAKSSRAIGSPPLTYYMVLQVATKRTPAPMLIAWNDPDTKSVHGKIAFWLLYNQCVLSVLTSYAWTLNVSKIPIFTVTQCGMETVK